MEVPPEELLDKHSTKYLKYFVNADLSQKEVLKALKQNPAMLNTPIVVHEKGADFVDNFYQLVQKDLTFQ
jgi:arsenate reductase-like glutaredoxin family protein